MTAPGDFDDAELKRLLADLRDHDPLPGDVVDRLDAVLAGLVAERQSNDTPVDLSAHRAQRRPRHANSVLVAAAVSGVLLFGGYLVQQGGGADSSGGAGADSSAAGDTDSAMVREASPEAVSGSAASKLASPKVTLRGDHLRSDVRRLLNQQALVDQSLVGEIGSECLAVSVPRRAERYFVAVDGQPAMVVVNQRQQVAVWPCGSTEPLARFKVR